MSQITLKRGLSDTEVVKEYKKRMKETAETLTEEELAFKKMAHEMLEDHIRKMIKVQERFYIKADKLADEGMRRDRAHELVRNDREIACNKLRFAYNEKLSNKLCQLPAESIQRLKEDGCAVLQQIRKVT